jgi:hypothetical protein
MSKMIGYMPMCDRWLSQPVQLKVAETATFDWKVLFAAGPWQNAANGR